ncbi:MAG TPA: hypothetical protein VF213_12365, partial [Dongiaceae bacterium]
VAKDSDSGLASCRDLLAPPEDRAFTEGDVMSEKTCAACDCELDADFIKVQIGGKTVEVCCEDCARKLKEAHASAIATRKG